MSLALSVIHKGKQVFATPLDAPLEIGRQQKGEDAPCGRLPGDEIDRVIIAPLAEYSLSRRQARLVPQNDGEVLVRNLSNSVEIVSEDRGVIASDGESVFRAPFSLSLGNFQLCVASVAEKPLESDYIGLENATISPGQSFVAPQMIDTISRCQQGLEADKLVRWLKTAMSVFEGAASSPDFLQRAARAVINLVQLDTVAIMLWMDDEWKTATVHAKGEAKVSKYWRASTTILDKARAKKCTFRNAPLREQAGSLLGVEALVAAPILDAEGKVIGAIYGDRRNLDGKATSLDMSEVDAMLVELIATGVAAGLARLEQEKAALAARVLFEQFFTPELARQLELEPDLLHGKDVTISVLFCDIREFSRFSEKLGPKRTVTWIRDVMEELSQSVLRCEGVLVDYVGDELIAMWGAPVEQKNHAALACKAAMEMVQCLQTLNTRWSEELGAAMDVGIGINTGIARVGNIGSKSKFKYGPLGNTVNLASRVQEATKRLRARVMITGHTESHLESELPRRLLSRVRVANIEEVVALYELADEPNEDWLQFSERYGKALEALEAKEFFTATKHLGNLIADFPDDGPTQLLLSRAVNGMINPGAFDSVWQLDSK